MRGILTYWPGMRNASTPRVAGVCYCLLDSVSACFYDSATFRFSIMRLSARSDGAMLALALLAWCAPGAGHADQLKLVVQSQIHGHDTRAAFAPLVEYLSDASGHRLVLQVPDSVLAHWQAMGRGEGYDLVLDEGHFTDYRVNRLDYQVLAKIAGTSGFSIVTGPATVFVEPDELHGEPVASPPPPSLAALRLVELFPDPIRAPILVEVDSYEEGIRRVISGEVAAAVIPSHMLRKHPQLNVVLSTEQEPGMALSAAPSVSAETREVIRRAFLAAADIDAGRRALARAGLAGFEPAAAELYDGQARLLRGTWGY